MVTKAILNGAEQAIAASCGETAPSEGVDWLVHEFWDRSSYGGVAAKMIAAHPSAGIGIGLFHMMGADYIRVHLHEVRPRQVRLQGRGEARLRLRAEVRLRRLPVRRLRLLQQGLSGSLRRGGSCR